MKDEKDKQAKKPRISRKTDRIVKTQVRAVSEKVQAKDYKDFFDNANELIQGVDADGKFIFVNKKWLEVMGYNHDEISSLNMKDIIHPDKTEDQTEILRRLHKGESLKDIPIIYKARDGHDIYLEGSLSAKIKNGKFVAARGIFRDITERKQAEEKQRESEERYRTLFESAAEGILIADSETKKFKFVNPTICKMLGYSQEELKEMNVADIHPKASLGHVIAEFEAMARGEKTVSSSIPCLKKDSTIIYVDIAMGKANIDGRECNVGFFTDVTDRKQVEEKIKESEEKYRSIVENSSDQIFMLDRGCNFLSVNKATADIFRKSPQELIGMSIFEILPENIATKFSENIKNVFDTGKSMLIEETMIAQGRELYNSTSLNPVKDAGEKVIAVSGIVRDITEQKRTEKALIASEQRYRTLFETAAEGIIIVDIETKKFKYTNPAICTMLDYGQEELTKMSASDIHPKALIEQVFAEFDAQARGEKKLSANLPCLKKDGTVIYADINITKANIDGRECYIGFFTDITDRRRMDAELQDKVQELVKANQRLKELDKLKDNFLSTVSHELRTPLTSIKSFAEIMLTYEEDRATQKEFLGIINEEADRLTRLINDFLDLAKIQAGHAKWETVRVPVSLAIETALNINHNLLTKNSLKLTSDIEPNLPMVWSDEDRLVQVVTNLVSNAIKFTPEGGEIGIRAQLTRKGNSSEKPDMVMISVTDSGIGIAPEHHQTIFEKFSQVGDTLKDRPKGTGLGLPICKEIVEHYSGTIWVESALGKGSTFFFTLPIVQKAPTPAIKIVDKISASALGTEKTILVVDDEANIRRLIGHELTNRGYKVIEATGGKEAIELARKFRPNLITLDIVMPDLDGFDVTVVLKSDPITKDIPIVIISVIEDKSKAYRLGANDYITKPFSFDVLMEKVNRLLSGSQKTILVVDDDKSLVKSIEFELKKRGFTTNSAHNGREAIQAVEKSHPNLILLNIKMPEMDGYEVIQTLKGNPDTADIHIVVMTGLEIDGGRVKALSIGATDYFNKSGELSRLFEAVENILRVGE